MVKLPEKRLKNKRKTGSKFLKMVDVADLSVTFSIPLPFFSPPSLPPTPDPAFFFQEQLLLPVVSRSLNPTKS